MGFVLTAVGALAFTASAPPVANDPLAMAAPASESLPPSVAAVGCLPLSDVLYGDPTSVNSFNGALGVLPSMLTSLPTNKSASSAPPTSLAALYAAALRVATPTMSPPIALNSWLCTSCA